MVGPASRAHARDRSRVSGRGNDFRLAGGDGRASLATAWARLAAARSKEVIEDAVPESAYERNVCARAQSFQSLKPGGATSISTSVELVIRARKDSAARIPASSLSTAMMSRRSG